MTETSIMTGIGTKTGQICTSSYPFLYPIKKIRDFNGSGRV